MPTPSVEPYDAFLLVSFGGPERDDDVLPFLQNVTRGRDIPADRLADVAEHYFAVGGRSPINDQCRAFLAAVRADFAAHDIDLPLYWGNRNWDPYLREAMAEMAKDGVRRAAALVTSAYSSYSGCRQYRENLFDAAAAVPGTPVIDKLRHYFNHPGFVTANADAVVDALAHLPQSLQDEARLVFVTHSIPTTMAETSGPTGSAYAAQHREVAALVTDRVAQATGRRHDFDLVYCSRSGSPRTPWLEPDVNDHLTALAASGVTAVVAAPIGFVSDHMEVVHDLDAEAAGTAASLGLAFSRAATAGTHPAFVASVRDLLVERAAVERGDPVQRAALGEFGPSWDRCLAGCCPNPRGATPALSEAPAAPVAT